MELPEGEGWLYEPKYDGFRALIGKHEESSFTGRVPSEASRWNKERKALSLLKPLLVVEVSTDHVTSDFMRHGARILRWRTDKEPEDCSLEQIRPASGTA